MIRSRTPSNLIPAVKNDELRIYFASNLVHDWAHGTVLNRRRDHEDYFTIDWRGCGELGRAGSGYSASAASLHEFAGHHTVLITLPTPDLQHWHANLRSTFMPKPGGYSIDEITRHIAQASRLMVRQRIPSALGHRFNPDTEIDRWYGDSHVRDKKYLPQLMFRASTAEQLESGLSMPGNIWFGSDGWDAHIVGSGPELAEAVLSIQAPLILQAETLLTDAMAITPIPSGYDGLIIQAADGSCKAAAVASPAQIRLAGLAHPDMEAWLQSWRHTVPMDAPPAEPAYIELNTP